MVISLILICFLVYYWYNKIAYERDILTPWKVMFLREVVEPVKDQTYKIENQIKEMLEDRYADAEKVILVMDNLNTHSIASLYTAFPPEEARRLAERLEIHYTPKHGGWLNIAEIEISVLKRQCLAGRIDCIEKMRSEVAAWNTGRNNCQTKVDWQFKTDNARTKLKRLYPKL